MKHIVISVFILLQSFYGKSQLYYNFSATAGSYTPLAGGTVAPLSAISTTYPATDEGFCNNVPIGFNFQYDGINRSSVNVNTNGFVTFGDPFFAANFSFDYKYYNNDLTNGPISELNRPIIAPLWDDLGLTASNTITYKTEGSSPNRIFTVQWQNVQWQNITVPAAVISFQLKFYETTNVVQFVYKQEAGTPFSPSASIGITTNKKGRSTFISVQSASANPAVSDTLEVKTIAARPATGQVYSFTPNICAAPNGLHTSGYNNSSVTFKWEPLSGATSYQYTVSTSATPPASGSNTTSNNKATVSGLLPATDYYIHLSNNCGTNWRTLAFTTAVAPLAVPFTDSFETAAPPDLPTNWRRENISNPLEDAQWESFSDATIAASGTNGLIVYAPYQDADNWAFTPSLNLTGGTMYKLRFKYAVVGGGVHALQVKMGNKVGKDSMMPIPLFSKLDIDNDVTNGGAYVDTTILFTTTATGTWYVGFNYIATVAASLGGFMVLDDVSVTAAAAMPVTLINFAGEQRNGQHFLHWQTVSEQNNTGFEVQQSSDGASFKKIGFVASQTVTGNSNTLLSYSFANEKILAGINYYRLRQIDKDGKWAYSKTIGIRPINNLAVSLLQNPVSSSIGIRVNATASSVFAISLFSTEGKLISRKNVPVSPGVQTIHLPMQNMAKGTYRLHIEDTNLNVKNLLVLKQ